MEILKLKTLLSLFIFFSFNSFSTPIKSTKDCGPIPPGGRFDENCKIAPVPPPHLNKVSRPNSPFIDTQACPFECCKYGDWIAKSELELMDRVDGTKTIARVTAGEKIQALTGEVHTSPNEVEVIRDHEKYKRGDIFYLLTSQGEGFYKVWFKGEIFSEEILFPGFTEKYDFKNCDSKKIECWGKIKNLNRNSVWWIKVKKKMEKLAGQNNQKNFLARMHVHKIYSLNRSCYLIINPYNTNPMLSS